MSKKSDFLVMDEMASNELDISSTTTVVQAQTVKRGGEITMGVEATTISKLALNTHVAVLYIIDREQFLKIKNG